MSKKKQKKEAPKVEENLFDEPEVTTEEVDVDALNAEAETELEDAILPEGAVEPKVDLEVMNEEAKPRRCIGHHPITKEKVYR